MPVALTDYEIGLLGSALVFIVFALVVALVVPRSRPTFPSKYLAWFIAACIVLFAAQMTAVILLAELGEEHEEVAREAESGDTTSTEPTSTEPTSTGPTSATDTTDTTGTTEAGEATTEAAAGGDPAVGKDVFLAAGGCGSCHTLADAGTTGTIGPNLDAAAPSFDKAVERVTNGAGAMPAFEDTLTDRQIRDVAAYVSSTAGG